MWLLTHAVIKHVEKGLCAPNTAHYILICLLQIAVFPRSSPPLIVVQASALSLAIPLPWRHKTRPLSWRGPAWSAWPSAGGPLIAQQPFTQQTVYFASSFYRMWQFYPNNTREISVFVSTCDRRGHNANFVVTGSTGGCRYNNFRRCLSRQSWHPPSSVTMCTWFWCHLFYVSFCWCVGSFDPYLSALSYWAGECRMIDDCPNPGKYLWRTRVNGPLPNHRNTIRTTFVQNHWFYYIWRQENVRPA